MMFIPHRKHLWTPLQLQRSTFYIYIDDYRTSQETPCSYITWNIYVPPRPVNRDSFPFLTFCHKMKPHVSFTSQNVADLRVEETETIHCLVGPCSACPYTPQWRLCRCGWWDGWRYGEDSIGIGFISLRWCATMFLKGLIETINVARCPVSLQRFKPKTSWIHVRFEVFTRWLWRMVSSGMLTPCGSCYNRRFGGT
jgi:hypothetical protein